MDQVECVVNLELLNEFLIERADSNRHVLNRGLTPFRGDDNLFQLGVTNARHRNGR